MTEQKPTPQSLPVGVIAAIAILITVVIFVLVAIAFWLARRYQEEDNEKTLDAPPVNMIQSYQPQMSHHGPVELDVGEPATLRLPIPRPASIASTDASRYSIVEPMTAMSTGGPTIRVPATRAMSPRSWQKLVGNPFEGDEK